MVISSVRARETQIMMLSARSCSASTRSRWSAWPASSWVRQVPQGRVAQELGTGGTCRTKLLAGQADHRDLVLAEHERADSIMICVSRARTDEITIDR